MALTKEIIKSNAILAGLTDDQVLAITTLSQNDENSVIGARFRETYNQLDETIGDATGVQRNGDEKTYKYLERAVKEYASRYADYDKVKADAAALRKANAELQKKIDSGGDPETEKRLSQARADLEAMKKQYSAVKSEYDASKAKWEKEAFDMRVDGALDAAKSSLKIKAGVNPQVARLAMKAAYDKVRSYSPSFEDDGKGGRTLQFHNPDGTTMNNAENRLAPFTAAELLARELSEYDILDSGTRPTGTGGAPIPPKGGSFLGVSTQVQATEAITRDLAAKGIARNDPAWQTAFDKAWDDGHVSDLPLN